MTSRSSRFACASVGLLAALGAAPAGVGAQQIVGAPAWLRARLDGRLDARARAAVERVIDSAYAVGVPAEPLVDKALEGASKGAKPDVIVAVLRKLVGDLAVARQSLGNASLEGELRVGAAALRAGVDAKALEKLRRDRPGQPLSVALGVLTDLIARGVPVSSATQSVLELTKAGLADEQLVAFRRDVERDVGMGAPPAAAATLRASTLQLNFATQGPGAASGTPGGRGKLRP